MIFGSILAPFSTSFQSLWHHFGILFQCRFFDDFLMPFWITFSSKSIHPAAIPDVTFFILFLVFPGPRSRGRFWMDFDGFWIDFWRILMDFWCIFMSFSQQFRIIVGTVDANFWIVSARSATRAASKRQTIRATILRVSWLVGWLVGWLSSSNPVSCPVSTFNLSVLFQASNFTQLLSKRENMG